MMETERQILKRAGVVVLTVGLIKLGISLLVLARGTSRTVNLELTLPIAGIFLLCGNWWAISKIRWISLFLLGFYGLGLLMSPFIQPWDLTLTDMRLTPAPLIISSLYFAITTGLSLWLLKQLGREPVKLALEDAGYRLRDARRPVVIGIAAGAAVCILMWYLDYGTKSAAQAVATAEQQCGPGYRYHVASISISSNSSGTTVASVVTAWNDREIRNVPVHFREQ
jgi:hypothetical protein